MTKVFGVAAALAAALVYKNNAGPDKPVMETKLFKQEESGERKNLRNEAYAQRYKQSFIKNYMRDKGGIGQRKFLSGPDTAPVPTVLIGTHSPYVTEFGAGIKTDQLGPRRERIRIFAPLND